jgi:hypothetical protein
MAKNIKESVKRELVEGTATAVANKLSPEIQSMFRDLTLQHRQLLTRMRDIENLITEVYTSNPKKLAQPKQKSLPAASSAPNFDAIPAELKPAMVVASVPAVPEKRRPGRPRKNPITPTPVSVSSAPVKSIVKTQPRMPEPTNKLVKKDQVPAGFETINNYLSRNKIQFNRDETLVFSNRCRKIVREKGLSTQIQVDAGFGIIRNCYTTEILDVALKSILDERGALPVAPVNPNTLKREQARHVLAL